MTHRTLTAIALALGLAGCVTHGPEALMAREQSACSQAADRAACVQSYRYYRESSQMASERDARFWQRFSEPGVGVVVVRPY